jgi:MFS family permease
MLAGLSPDARRLIAGRAIRMFAFGALSVVLAVYLVARGLNERQVGLLLTLPRIGDAAVALWITSIADRLGRRRMLKLGAILMVFGGGVFALGGSLPLLAVAALIGTLSPSGNEVGPFLPIEQAALAGQVPERSRTSLFAWYNLVGSVATALGALVAGVVAQGLQGSGTSPIDSYRTIMVGYAVFGGLLWLLCWRLSPAVEVVGTVTRKGSGLHRSRGVVYRLAGLFSLDAFAGGLIVQTLIAYWFAVRFGLRPGAIGAVFFGANLAAAASALLAARIANRIGLINTMVFTHLPSNVMLMLVPLMPTAGTAIALLLARFSISQMDVPTRQSYVIAVVDEDERSAATGVTGVARTVGASLAPALSGTLLTISLSLPFFLAGALKIVYDLTLYRAFRKLRPPHEM